VKGSNRQAIGLGVAQTIAWASTYYLPAVLADTMGRDLGLGGPAVFAGLSLALLIAAVIGPVAGGLIDRHGGRRLLAASSGIFAIGLALLAGAGGAFGFYSAWSVLGCAMGCGLYEGAFAALVVLHGGAARRSITVVALVAGFASTLGWPLTTWMADLAGWRIACLVWAVLHLLVALPVHLAVPDGNHATAPVGDSAADVSTSDGRRIALLLSVCFAVTWFISTAMAAHLPRLLEMGGLSAGMALACAMLVGPAQVAARLLEFSLLGRLHPLFAARLAAAAHPLGALILFAGFLAAAPIFAVLHGGGNGILTIAKGTLPLILLGSRGYGERQGWIMVPARIGQAAAPLAVGLACDAWGLQALWLTIALGGVGWFALMLVQDVPNVVCAVSGSATPRQAPRADHEGGH
jgi:predicted MFS family arabinose efflux permease